MVLGATLFLNYVKVLCSGKFCGDLISFAEVTALIYKGENWSKFNQNNIMTSLVNNISL